MVERLGNVWGRFFGRVWTVAEGDCHAPVRTPAPELVGSRRSVGQPRPSSALGAGLHRCPHTFVEVRAKRRAWRESGD